MILMPQIFDVTANENACYKRNELECYINIWAQDFPTKLFTWFTNHIFSIIVKENQTSPDSILQKQVLYAILRN